MKWISVYDKSPMDDQHVLVYGKYDDFDEDYLDVNAFTKKDGFSGNYIATITHWMPLPNPPES